MNVCKISLQPSALDSTFSNKLVDVIEFQGLTDSLLSGNLIKLKMILTFLCVALNTPYSKRWLLKKT